MQETGVRALGREDPLEEETATRSNIFVCRVPCTEEPGGATVHRVTGSQTRLSLHAHVAPVLCLVFLCFFFFFALEVYEILASLPGIKPTSLTLEGRVLTTGAPAKPHPPALGSPLMTEFLLCCT